MCSCFQEKEKEINKKESKTESADKYLGTWRRGEDHELTITKFGSSYKVSGCANCPYSGILKDGILYVEGSPCVYDEKSDHMLFDGFEYRRAGIKN